MTRVLMERETLDTDMHIGRMQCGDWSYATKSWENDSCGHCGHDCSSVCAIPSKAAAVITGLEPALRPHTWRSATGDREGTDSRSQLGQKKINQGSP